MRDRLYDLVVSFLRLVVRIFFRSVEVSGLENVPAAGPVVFVGNHPNSLLDPVLITTTCGRRVRFAAKETLFRALPLRPLLWVLGSVPIKRRQDQIAGRSLSGPEDAPVEGAPARVDNDAAFDALYAILDEGSAFGIFPEGISHTRPELAPLKTGAARIALGAAQKGITARIVPCGLHYRRRTRMRSRVLVQFGEPFIVDPARAAAAEQDPAGAARALTGDIGLALRALTINTKDFDTLKVLELVRVLYRPQGLKLSLAQESELLRRFIDGWERLQDVPAVKALYDDTALHLAELEALGLTDATLRAGHLSFVERAARVLGHLAFLAVLVPFAVPGFILHLPVLVTAVVAGETLTQRDDVKATIKVVAATVLTLLTYCAVAGSVLSRNFTPAGAAAAVLLLVGLALSGYATIRVLEGQHRLRRGLKTLLQLFHLDEELVRLRAVRESLRVRLLELVNQHMDKDLPRIIAATAHTDAIPWLDDDDAD